MSANPAPVLSIEPCTLPFRRVEAPAQRARRAARDRARKLARKHDCRTPEQRQAAALHTLMRGARADYPALEGEIDQFLYLLGQRISETKDRVIDSIMHMLKSGPASMDDFLEELRFSELSVTSALEYLHTRGVVREVPRGRASVWQLTGVALAALPAGVLP
jgi:hypothetical protein